MTFLTRVAERRRVALSSSEQARGSANRGATGGDDETMKCVPSGAHALMLATALALAPSVASAQGWPSRFVTVVVPFPAGGPTDLLARAIADRARRKARPAGRGREPQRRRRQCRRRLRRQGGAGRLHAPASPPPAWSTTGSCTRACPTTPSATSRRSLLISKTPIIFVAKATGPKTLDELIAHAKANPGKLNFGTPGHGTAAHITFELFEKLAGIKMTHVPYRGSAPMIGDLLGNQIDVVVRPVADAGAAGRRRQISRPRGDQHGARRRRCPMCRRCRRADFPASRRRRGTR